MINTGKFNAELPRFEGTSEEKFAQLETFLYRLVENLRFAFSNVGLENLDKELTDVIDKKVDAGENVENVKSDRVDTKAINITRVKGENGGFLDFDYEQDYKNGTTIKEPGASMALYEGDTEQDPAFMIITQRPPLGPSFNLLLSSIGRLILEASLGIDLPDGGSVRVGGISLDEYIKSVVNS